MKNIIPVLFSLLISFPSFSQNFDVPKDVHLETKEDYAQYEGDIIKAVDWLIKTPVGSEKDKRLKVNAFLLQWLTGSPNVMIEITQEIATFMDCSDCLMIFMGGWAKYSLENNDYADKIKGNLAGIESVIEFYNSNKGILGKNNAIEKYAKLKNKGKLEKHIQSKI
jgi:hypothetical protein